MVALPDSKYHLAGVRGDVEPCKKVPGEVRWQMKQLVDDIIKEKEKRKRQRFEIGSYCGDDSVEADDVVEIDRGMSRGKRSVDESAPSRKGVQSYFALRTNPGSQPSIRSEMASKEMVDNARMAVARWWYDANVSFNAANSVYYQPMIDAIAGIGPGLKGPFPHDFRGSLLKDVVQDDRIYLSGIKAEWGLYGCSVMSDGWTNQKQ